MSNKSISKMFKAAAKFLSRNKSSILIGTGIVGMYSAIAESIRVTPKAVKRIEARKVELKVEKLPVMETVKTAGPCYIPAMLMAGASTGCIIGGTASNMRQNAALAAAYTASESALEEYKNTVIDTVGEKKAAVIQDNLVKKQIADRPESGQNVIITGEGDTKCFDTFTGRYFRSNIEKVRQGVNNINMILNTDQYASLNDLHSEWGIKNGTIGGEELGFSLYDGLIEASFDSVLDENNQPCLAITIEPRPKYNYDRS